MNPHVSLPDAHWSTINIAIGRSFAGHHHGKCPDDDVTDELSQPVRTNNLTISAPGFRPELEQCCAATSKANSTYAESGC